MNAAWWLLVVVLLWSTWRGALDIALDRVRERPWRQPAAWAVVATALALLDLAGSHALKPVGIALLLEAAVEAGHAWLLRRLPASTLPPVRY